MGVNCSKQYLEDIKSIFEWIDIGKYKSSKWGDLYNKEDDIYVPLLDAFKGKLE